MEAIHGHKIYLRPTHSSDADLVYRWENNPEVWEISQTAEPFTKEEIEKFVCQLPDLHGMKQLRLIICEKTSNRAIGAIDLFDFDARNRRAGVGILIAEMADRDVGFGGEALDLLMGYCTKNLNLVQLYCNILVDNVSSISLFKSKGFEEVGVKRAWIKSGEVWKDEILLQMVF